MSRIASVLLRLSKHDGVANREMSFYLGAFTSFFVAT